MNFKVIAKQIYKGFLVNWRIFLMLILFCTAAFSMIFGSFSFLIQFKNEIYQPAFYSTAFSIGHLKNDFSYSDNSEVTFKTNKKFETYFLNQINKIGETENSEFKFDYNDLQKIYQEDGYVSFVETNDDQKEAYEKLINYSADYLGNIRFKIIDQYLKEQTNWNFNFWNNQTFVGRLVGSSGLFRLFTTNIETANNVSLLRYKQLIPDDPNFISVYVSEKQFNVTNKLNDLLTVKFDNMYQSKNMQVKVVGTFIDSINFANSGLDDNRFLIDNKDYFDFVKEQNIGYEMLDYRNETDLSIPRFNLFTGESLKVNRDLSNYPTKFNETNRIINNLLFDNFTGISLDDEFKTTYTMLDQRYVMTLLIMLGISLLLIVLFYNVLYFLITQTIKTDLKISFFLNNLGMTYREISWIQILRLTIPICLSIILAIFGTLGIKGLFWSAFSSSYNVHFSLVYFNWENLLLLLISVFLIFGILFLINYLINWKMGKNKNSFDRVTFADKISAKTKSFLKIKNHRLVVSLSYGAKNFFQVLFITLITFLVFLITGLSANFTKNIQNISQFAGNHYFPIQSISTSKGDIIGTEELAYNYVKNEEFNAIGDNLDLVNDDLRTLILELNKLNNEDISNFYLSHNFTKQISETFADNFSQLEYQNLEEDIKESISEENFHELQKLVNSAALVNNQLNNNFDWREGFNVNFGQWTNTGFSSLDQTFFSLENSVYSTDDDYLASGAETFAVDSNEPYYQENFSHLNDEFFQNMFPISKTVIKSSTNKNENNKVFTQKLVNAYFPYQFKEESILKLYVYLNNQITTEIYLRNVGVNLFDNWAEIFVLNKKQVFEALVNNVEDESAKGVFEEILASENLDQLDNGVYSTAKLPFFYRNVLLRNDGQGTRLSNYLFSLEDIDIYGLNFDQIQNLIRQSLSQYNQLITSIQILLIILMATISFIIIFLVVKENETYFQNFKALGYKTREIANFLLPWYFIGTVGSALISFIIIFFTNNLLGTIFSSMLNMYLNYQVSPLVYVLLTTIPILFLLLFSVFIYFFIRQIKVANIVI